MRTDKLCLMIIGSFIYCHHHPWWEPHFLQPLSCDDAIGHPFPGTMRQAIASENLRNQLRDVQRHADSVEPTGLSPTELEWFVGCCFITLSIISSLISGLFPFTNPLDVFLFHGLAGKATCVCWPLGISDLSVFHWHREQGEQLGAVCHLRSGCWTRAGWLFYSDVMGIETSFI